MQYHFINENTGIFKIDEMCKCLGLKRSGYYAWRDRQPSARELEDATLKERIEEIYDLSKGRYGHRPVYHHLQEEDYSCGRDRTLRLMNELGLAGIQKKRFKPLMTDSDHEYGYHPNLLKDQEPPSGCNEVWVADTTYLRVHGGWCYLATVMDLYSRRIVGWSVSANNDSKLVCEALRAAIGTRGGRVPEGVIHHSDRGSTYASYDYQRLIIAHRMRPSMSRKANCYDNAAMESFYGQYKTSSVREGIFPGEEQARRNAFEYIEIYYNRFRKHGSLGYKNPVLFEESNSLSSPPPAGGGDGEELSARVPSCTICN